MSRTKKRHDPACRPPTTTTPSMHPLEEPAGCGAEAAARRQQSLASVSHPRMRRLRGSSGGGLGLSLIESSMRRIVMAASVAKRRHLILEMAGSRTPWCRLSRVEPVARSRPVNLSSPGAVVASVEESETAAAAPGVVVVVPPSPAAAAVSSGASPSLRSGRCARECTALSRATRSIASHAALTARVRGMTRSASAKSATASCSRVPSECAKLSKKTLSAASTAPPPATTAADSRTRLTTMRTSWSARSSSSRWNSFAPRSTTVHALALAVPRT
mmetsp:Transcript_20965/g.83573  ORF Transcript_20965/g.83573 Transcript_20965/m.83573 type:complete len:274 (+) Transcript_20965:291-1112(+)